MLLPDAFHQVPGHITYFMFTKKAFRSSSLDRAIVIVLLPRYRSAFSVRILESRNGTSSNYGE